MTSIPIFPFLKWDFLMTGRSIRFGHVPSVLDKLRRYTFKERGAVAITSRSSRWPPDCRPTSTSSPAASSGPSSSCRPEAISPWRRSPQAPASRTKASSPITTSVWSASRRDNSAGQQESHRSPQIAPRTRAATPLPFGQDRGAGRCRRPGGERCLRGGHRPRLVGGS